MSKKTAIILLILLYSLLGLAQTKSIKIEANHQALNSVLLQLRNQYNIQFSYSDNELAKFYVTLHQTFNNKEEAIKFLLKDLPFVLKKTGDVFIIIPQKKKEKEEKQTSTTRIGGQIVEAGSFEPLPFSHILINNHQMVSDVMGSFNYTASTDSSFHVQISHLGYYIYDTVLVANTQQKFKLTPSSENIQEITVRNNVVEKATMIGEKSGKIKINHTISRFLPGQGDNSVFNLLRLMPGIQAAGEQSTDLLIWGSYEGQSQITFDEFTIFGLKNYNDNISVVNPFLVKNIEIYKGGYEAKYGNRVGGLVNISGKNGNINKPSFSFNINPTTVNGLLEIPILKKSSLMLAYRQTYYNLYNSEDFNIYAPTRATPKSTTGAMKSRNIDFDINVYPDDYQFRDLNLKYSLQLNNGDFFYVSAYGGGDLFSLSTTAEINAESKTKGRFGMNNIVPLEILYLNNEKNTQKGLSTFYGKTWKNGLNSKLILSHSDFSRALTDEIHTEDLENKNSIKSDLDTIQNEAFENNLRIENILPLKNGSQLDFGGGIYENRANISNNSNTSDSISANSLFEYEHQRAYIYLQDNRQIRGRLSLKTGLRLNLMNDINRYLLEPRLGLSYQLNEKLKFNASWGLYNQFMYKIANVDQNQNYTYLWVTSNANTPALSATHWVSGFNYFNNNFTINIEGYYKTIQNISQRVFENRELNGKQINRYFLYQGNAKTYGIDSYIKKDFGRHSIWASYTLSKTLESLAPIGKQLPDYELAPHDQRHEFKLAGIFNIKDFYLSGNYVYGSGMEILRKVFEDQTDDVSYQRFDAAITYTFNLKHLSGETGLSVLNIFDTQNLKYANLKNIHISQDIGTVKIYSNAVPFTPILFLKLVF
ncbi:MAG: TonB-dependent receptor domain-containing protein [Prolixibacteraceae bacterium]